MWPTALVIVSVALMTLLLLWVLGLRAQARRLGGARVVPPWAAFWTLPDYRAFSEAVELALANRELEAVSRDGVVAVALPDGRPLQLGLQNLAQQCSHLPRERWAPLIEEHLDALLGAEAEANAMDRRDFDTVKPVLKVRLYPEEALEDSEADAVVLARPVPGLAAVLVYDFAHTVASVPREEANRWERTDDELRRVGLENLAEEPSPDRKDLEVERGVVLRLLSGSSFFVSSQLLRLEHFLPPKLPYGALVCAPTRHLLVIHLIRDSRVLLAINAMIPRSFVACQSGPGSLLPDLYWWHRGELTLLPTSVEKDSVKFTPPAKFVERVMEPLAAD